MGDLTILAAQPASAGTMVGPVQVDSPALLVARAYEVVLGRTGEVAGLQNWQAVLVGGASLEEVLQGFTGSPEFAALYGYQTDEQFVTALYANAFGRAPDANGLDFWVGQLTAGAATRADVVTGFYYAPEGAAHIEQLASNAGGLAPPEAGLQLGAAKITANADNANIEASTYTAGAFAITNTGLQPIAQVQIDLSTTALPDLVFDPPDGSPAGDSLGKGFQVDGEGGTGVIIPADINQDPFSGAYKNGFTTLTIDFQPGTFATGEALTFSADIDPTSIQGQIGSGSVGSVSGLELTGATIRVTYADGRTQTGQILGDGSLGGGEAHLNAVLAATPTVAVGGLGSGSTGVLSSSAQTVAIGGGLPGGTVQVQVIEATLGTLNPSQPISPSDPQFDANTAGSVTYFSTVLDGNGAGSVDISIALAADTDARYYVSAASLQELDAGSPGLEVADFVTAPIIFTVESQPLIA